MLINSNFVMITMTSHMPMFYDRANEQLVQPLRRIAITDTHLASHTIDTYDGLQTIGLLTDFTHHVSALSKDRGGLRHSNDAQAYEDAIFKSRGTRETPVATLTSDELYKLRVYSYDGFSFDANGEILISNDAVSATRGNMALRTRNAAGDVSTKILIGSEDVSLTPDGDLTLEGDECAITASTGKLTLEATAANVELTTGAAFVVDAANGSQFPDGLTAESGTHVTLWGNAIPDTAGDIAWRKCNETVTLLIPSISSAVFSAANAIVSTVPLPANLRPNIDRVLFIVAEDNSTLVGGKISISNDGTIYIRPGFVSGAAYSAANLGMIQTSVTYAIS